MPDYQKQNLRIQSLEARSSELVDELHQGRFQLEGLQADEDVTNKSVLEAQRELVASEELEVEVSQEVLEL